jgi:hypothetical protein
MGLMDFYKDVLEIMLYAEVCFLQFGTFFIFKIAKMGKKCCKYTEKKYFLLLEDKNTRECLIFSLNKC